VKKADFILQNTSSLVFEKKLILLNNKNIINNKLRICLALTEKSLLFYKH